MKHKSKNPIALAKWIWQSYLRTALIPIILIELLFLGVFFGINIVMKNQLQTLVLTAADNQITRIVKLEAAGIGDQLTNARLNTKAFAAQMEQALRLPAVLSANDLNRLQYTPDGAYYTTADKGGAAVFYSGIVPVNEQERQKVARALSMQGFMRDICDASPLVSAVFLNTSDSLTVRHPYVDVLEYYRPQTDLTALYFYEADAAHNPTRRAQWTNIYLDITGQDCITSCIAPVYDGEAFKGVVGIDVSIGHINEQLLKEEIPADGYMLLVDNKGAILALTERAKEDWAPAIDHEAVGTDDSFVLTSSLANMPDMKEFGNELAANESGIKTISLGEQNKRVSWGTIEETSWKLLLVVPEKSIFGTIDRVGSSVQKVGIFLAAALILFFALFFRALYSRSKKMSRSLAEPLAALNTMAQDIGAGNYYQPIQYFGVNELQETSSYLVNMGHRLGEINRTLLSAQTELKEKESYLQAVIHSIDDAIVELDENGVITNIFINETSYTPSNLTPKFSSIEGIFTSVKAEAIRSTIKNVIATGRVETIDTDLETSTGRHWVVARFSLISRDSVRVVVTARDITERKKLEESISKARDDAEAANRAKSQFLSSMSHELRTPLNAVLGFAQVLEMDPAAPLTGMQKECVYEIMQAGNHLLELITEVLDLARIEAGKTRLSIEPIDIGVVFEETMTLIMPTAEKYKITVNAESALCAHKFVLADKTKLKQVLINLLSNAIKYNKPGGKVDYYCDVADGSVRFHVIDTGVGIPEGEIEEIFKPFHRLNNTKNVIEGTGVGLSLVKQLTEMMGGVIRAESTEGVGSHFFIELPATEAAFLNETNDLEEKVAAADTRAAANKRILYIEDNMANLRLVERILSLVPETILLTAQTAKIGIELARCEKPDVILLDINLPDMDGYEVFTKLREYNETVDIPIIAVSSNAMEREINRALQLGFADYITKPIKADVFFERIQKVFTKE